MTRPVVRRNSAFLAPAVCISIALILVLLVGGWGAYRDLTVLRQSVIQAELSKERSHAERSVIRINAAIVDDGLGADLGSSAWSSWLHKYWLRTIPTTPACFYAAIVDVSGKVLSHSDWQHEGQVLSAPWDATSWTSFGEEISETSAVELTGGVSAVDVAVPIRFQNQLLGTLHMGIDRKWLDERVAYSWQRAVQRWVIVIAMILCVVLLTSVSLHRINHHTSHLKTALAMSETRRIAEVSQLIVGMAHEVRNPLNAVRLNLYSAEKMLSGEEQLMPNEVDALLGESVREIERVENLIQQLLGYARKGPQRQENLELTQEVRSALQFLRLNLDQARVSAEISARSESVMVRMDRGCLRQILLNLINNACEAAGQGGEVVVNIVRRGDCAELSIRDTGPGVQTDLSERIFDPFFTTKEFGTGMGLAMVRSLVEMAGGSIHCEMAGDGGYFRLAIPCVN